MVQGRGTKSGQDYLEFFAPEDADGEPGWYWWPCSHGCIPDVTIRDQPTSGNAILDYRKPTYTYKYDHQLYGAPPAPSQSTSPKTPDAPALTGSSQNILSEIFNPPEIPSSGDASIRQKPPGTLPPGSRLKLPELSTGLQDLKTRLSTIQLPQLPRRGGADDVVEGQFRVLPPDTQQGASSIPLPAALPPPSETQETAQQNISEAETSPTASDGGDASGPPPLQISQPPPDDTPEPAQQGASAAGDSPSQPIALPAALPPPSQAPLTAQPSAAASKSTPAMPAPKKDDDDKRKKDKKQVGGYDETDLVNNISRSGMQSPMLNITPKDTGKGYMMSGPLGQRSRSRPSGSRGVGRGIPQRVNIEIKS